MPATFTPGTTGYNPQVDTTLIEAGVLRILSTKSIGIYTAATIQNPSTIKAGRAIFRKPELIQSKDYDFTNRNENPDLLSMELIAVDLDQSLKASYEVDEDDKAQLGAIQGAIEAQVSRGLSLNITATLDAEFIKLAYNQAIANGAGAKTGYIINADYSTARTQATLDTMYYDTTDMERGVRQLFTKSEIGVDRENSIIITAPGTLQRLIKSAGASGPQYENVKNGLLTQINGLNISEHDFIGADIGKGTSWSKDRDYLFSKLEAIFVNTEAIALPMYIQTIKQTVGENSGNDKVILRYGFGRGIIRAQLIRAIFNATPTPLTFYNLKGKTIEGYDGQYHEDDQIKTTNSNIELIQLKKQNEDLKKRIAKLPKTEKPKPKPVAVEVPKTN